MNKLSKLYASFFAASSITMPLGSLALANTTYGNCSPIVIGNQSTVTVSGCGLSASAAARLQSSMNASIRQNRLTQTQIQTLVALANANIAQTNEIEKKLDILLESVNPQSSSGGDSGRSGGILRDTLSRTVQRVSDLRITLNHIEGGYGRISVYFDLVNEGVQEYRNVDVFGGGSFGNGGSTLIVAGREILASGIEFAGNSADGLIRTNIVPGVHYSGRVDFNGVYANIDDVDVLKLAFSDNNLRPSTYAMFRLSQ